MALDRAAVLNKLSAIRAKSAVAIHAAGVHIPGLGSDYTRLQLGAWLRVREQFLESVLSEDEQSRRARLVVSFAAMSDEGREKARALLRGELPAVVEGDADFERLTLVRLLKLSQPDLTDGE